MSRAERTAVLQVFTKAPVAGRVKTRLAETLGAARALAVYVALAERTLGVARAARDAGAIRAIELWCEGETDDATLQRWAVECRATVRSQQGGDLGARMEHALGTALDRGLAPILVGCDCPLLAPDHVAQAVAALRDHDVVFAPAEDGGYVLVGMRRRAACFDRIPWGTSEVMAATRLALRATHATWAELPTLWDVDVPTDYERWRALGS